MFRIKIPSLVVLAVVGLLACAAPVQAVGLDMTPWPGFGAGWARVFTWLIGFAPDMANPNGAPRSGEHGSMTDPNSPASSSSTSKAGVMTDPNGGQ